MPNSVQYPLERERDLQRKWARLLQRTASSTRAPVNAHSGSGLLSRLPPLVDTTPPRDWDEDDDLDDDEEVDEDEVNREPAVIREPDKDE
jgi:hypothetical protein